MISSPDREPVAIEGIEEAQETYTPGSGADFDRLYRASYQRIKYTLLGVLADYEAAEDCAQETFVRAYRAWSKWTPDAPAEAWLHRIALNVALTYQRWHRLREVGEIVRRFGVPKQQVEPVDSALQMDLANALKKLPPEQSAAIIMRHVHGYSNRDIAIALGISESTVASRLAAAKQRLRKELK
jgi:RNA polymerase sigma-70 factor (ECF subfamily)